MGGGFHPLEVGADLLTAQLGRPSIQDSEATADLLQQPAESGARHGLTRGVTRVGG